MNIDTLEYRNEHALCPKCLNKDVGSTTVGCISEPYKDTNHAHCKCGWEGIVHDLVPKVFGQFIVTLEDYIPLARSTSATKNEPVITKLLHAAFGLSTETGEFSDGLKRKLFYGKPLDLVNLEEELGDILWYIAEAMVALGVNPSSILKRNLAKLKKVRFPEGFNSNNALNRDLDKEREILEGE